MDLLEKKNKIEAEIAEKVLLETIDPPEGLYEKLGIIDTREKRGVSEGRINNISSELAETFSFYRAYPDVFLDTLADPEQKFEFFFYQRLFLRSIMRPRYASATFPRAYSKSFLSILGLYVKCTLYPGAKLFIVSGGKEQSAKIAKEKLDEIWQFFPALKNELIWGKGHGTTQIQNDYINLRFKNGSYLDIVAAKQSSRGGRRTGGLIEEAAQVPGDILSEVVIPMMNVSRRAPFGGEDPNDITNKSQIYINFIAKKLTFL